MVSRLTPAPDPLAGSGQGHPVCSNKHNQATARRTLAVEHCISHIPVAEVSATVAPIGGVDVGTTPASGKFIPELKTFGMEIRRMREAAGINQTRLAVLVNVSRAYVSHVELGKTRCRADFAARIDGALHAEGEIIRAWDELLETIKSVKYPEFFANFQKAEQSAIMLRAYEDRIVHGLFQREEYARVILQDEDAVINRMRRQAILFGKNAPSVTVVMDETVLYRQVGGRGVMRAQLEFLLELSEMENVNIQIAPIQYTRNVWSTFVIATLSDQRQVVYTAKAYGGETSSDPVHLAKVNETMSILQAEALNVRDTRALIREVIKQRWA
ncbi:helix-turn-helix transcriptional regulator [Actinomadura sp. WMMB 499]|uniref:helix-turn-helix domain-containing protein n=1 Tax=Actinomadura sp. WMMB 499 TaxID=1219491 RepID=UPI00124900E4|nr:helix-turn-helix transcriptional regulator [Actinomadura sp. WMMB 499]QFG22075.1 helix-turn-helix domain-containing protein [Actinomadura sp. WMMB 499]